MVDAMLAAKTQWGWCIFEHESSLKIGGPHKLECSGNDKKTTKERYEVTRV